MRNYKELAVKNLQMQWRRNLLTSVAIVLAVASAVAIFSLMDTLIQFRINQAKHEDGAFHFQVAGCNEQELENISKESGVERLGVAVDLGTAKVESGHDVGLSAYDAEGAKMLGIALKDGVFPEKQGTIAVEEWFLRSHMKGTSIGGTVKIKYKKKNGEIDSHSFTLCGVLQNSGRNESKGVPDMVISLEDAAGIAGDGAKNAMVWVGRNKSIKNTVRSLKTGLSIADNRIVPNKTVLMLTDPENPIMQKVLYPSGILVVAIVIFASAIMIYNAINISIMDRIKQFGLLKCIGMTNGQIIGMVLRESVIIALVSILPGVLVGCAVAVSIVIAIKSSISDLIGRFIPVMISSNAIIAGIATGLITVLNASVKPAQRASRVSPVHLVSGSAFAKLKKNRASGFLSKILPVEAVMAVRNVLLSKTTFMVTSLSLASGLFMFLTFNVMVDFLDISKAATRPYYCDFTLESQNLCRSLQDADFGYDEAQQLSSFRQVEKIYLKRYMPFTAKVPRTGLTPEYVEFCENKGAKVVEGSDGLVVPADSGKILSYDDEWMRKTKDFLLSGSVEGVINGNTQRVLVVGGEFLIRPQRECRRAENDKNNRFESGRPYPG